MLRGQFTAISAYIDREWSQNNNLTSHFKALGKEQQTKPSREKEIIKIRDKKIDMIRDKKIETSKIVGKNQ